MSRPHGDYEGTTRKITLPPMPPVPEAWHLTGAAPEPGTAYATVNRNADGDIVEVFLVFRRHVLIQGTANALCRLISLSLQRGVPLADVVATISGQHDGLPAVRWRGSDGGFVRSIADALAKVLEQEGGL